MKTKSLKRVVLRRSSNLVPQLFSSHLVRNAQIIRFFVNLERIGASSCHNGVIAKALFFPVDLIAHCH